MERSRKSEERNSKLGSENRKTKQRNDAPLRGEIGGDVHVHAQEHSANMYFQIGSGNSINVTSNASCTSENLLDIKDEGGRTILRVNQSWIHEAPADSTGSQGTVKIKINVVDKSHAEDRILREYADHPNEFHKLIKEGCGDSMYLVSVHRGSVMFEIKTDNFETISSLNTSLKKGTFYYFLIKLFKKKKINNDMKGEIPTVSVQFIIPKQLIEEEETVGEAKAKVKDIIRLDKMERTQKGTVTVRIRAVADVIERAEQNVNRTTLIAAVSAGSAVFAVITLGPLAVAAAVGMAAVATVTAWTKGTYLLNLLKSDPFQISAESSRKEYVDVCSKYRDALLKVPLLKEIDNQVVLSLLEDIDDKKGIDEPSRLTVLRSYLQNPTSVRVNEKIEIRIESEILNLEDMTLLDILKMVFGLSGSSVERTRGMANQIEKFEILEAP